MRNLAWRGEHGQVGELLNMDPLPWLLLRFLYKLKSLNRELIYAILMGNQNIFMCKWLLVYIAYFILYGEFGQLGELFNMDPLPWLLQRFFLNWRISRDNFIYDIIVWNKNIFMCKCKLVNIAYFILYGEYETCLDVKLGFILMKLNVFYERDIVVGIS